MRWHAVAWCHVQPVRRRQLMRISLNSVCTFPNPLDRKAADGSLALLLRARSDVGRVLCTAATHSAMHV